jgi:cystathionine beta-lyase/cystathionine gamma-synthase
MNTGDTGFRGFDTKLIHAGEPRPRILGAVALPIFQSVTFEHTGPPSHEDVRYIRLSNTPNHLALHEKLAALEDGEAALVTASGMAAISTTLLTVLSAGDHLLAQSCLYGGTLGFLGRECPSFGIAVDAIDAGDAGSWRGRLRPTTRAIYVETMTNPLLEVGDLRAVVEFARAHGLVSIIDNTFATPVNFRPPAIGFDLSLHSCTKYMNGHDDLAAGAVIGRAEWITKIGDRLRHLGGALDPHAAFLLHRGLKTLGVRVRHQNESALRIARFLEGHAAVARINYPGLESHPNHARARALFDGFGGTMSFDLAGGRAAADRMLRDLRLPRSAPSLGGVESLVMPPARVSHGALSAEERARLGIGDGLVRLSVGLETTEDLIDDLERALGGAI